ncbi:MAG: rane fusion protein [Deltaproteobacteria bacterium]|jgi:HlyD family secretion protein|nr:rane fusion protein [Deltaproteobacteria bacterium]
MQLRRWIIVIIITVGVISAIVYGFMPKPVSVDLVKVSRGPLKVTVEEEGRTRVKDRFVVSAPVAGFMRRIQFDVGDRVQKGQSLVELEPLKSNLLDPRSHAAAQAAVSSAEASLKVEEERARAAAADAEYARTNLERIRKLYEGGYVAKDALEQAETGAKRAGANLLSAEAAVKVARFELERAQTVLRHSAAENTEIQGKIVTIQSPVNGSVLKIYRESEGVVQSGEPVIDIGDPEKLEVKVEVLSADAVKIKPGASVLFERWGGNSTLPGRVRVVEPAGFTKISSLGVEEQRVLVIVDLTSSDKGAQSLGDGYRLEASFIIWEGKDILQAPASGLFRNQEGWAIFVVKNNRALKREVRVGQRTGLVAEVLSGLTEGEEVISHPDNSIEDRTRVRPR